MRRNGYALTVAAILLAVAVFGAASIATGQGDSTRVPVIILYDDGSWEYAAAPTATPSRTPTPPPTNTPRPTDTPVATSTPLYGTPATMPPSLTPTPVPSATPVFPTPTPQNETPVPGTPVPTVEPITCTGTVINAPGLSLRTSESTSASVIRVLAYNEQATILSMHVISDAVEEWARVRDATGNVGYVASYYYGGKRLLYWDDLQYECLPEGGMEITWDNPPPSTAWGLWTGPGASEDETLTMIAELKGAGIQPALTVYGANTLGYKAHSAGAWVMARPFIGDHPPYTLPAVESAQRWIDEAVLNIGAGGWYDCLVASNEPIYPSWEYARDWIAAAIQRADERGVECLVPVVFAPGHPELYAVPILAPAYQNAPIEVYWGLNLYPADPTAMLSDHGVYNWTTYRYEMYTPPAPIVVTEFARGDGSQTPDYGDIAGFVAYTDGDFRAGTGWYLAIPLGHWLEAVIRDVTAYTAAVIQGVQ